MLFVGTSIIHPSTEGVFLLCNILDLLIYRLKVVFEILDNKVVELKQFALAGCEDAKPVKRGGEDFFPITEVQITGRGTRGIHAYKHNASGGSLDFAYQSHKILENEKGKELI